MCSGSKHSQSPTRQRYWKSWPLCVIKGRHNLYMNKSCGNLLYRTAKRMNATAIGPCLFSGWTTELGYCIPTQTASEGKNNQKLPATALQN